MLSLRLPGLGRLDFAWRGWRRYWLAEERELRLVRYLVDGRRGALDIGANRGYYTFWLMRFARHVYAYEPNPANLFFLQFARGNVTVLPHALSDQNGQATFRVMCRRGHAPDHRTGRLGAAIAAAAGDGLEFPVQVRRLDDEPMEDVGFIKIDVEGHEMQVLEGGRELIQREHPTLLVEIESRHTGRPVAESIARVEAMGYMALALTEHGLRLAHTLRPEEHLQAERPGYVYNFLFLPR